MRLVKDAIRVLMAGTLLLGASSVMFSQEKQGAEGADRQKAETTITGCLSKDASGSYMIADEKTGAKSTVKGPSDLEKHSANHKVTLTGTTGMDSSGKPVFEATKIQHIAADCKAPAQ